MPINLLRSAWRRTAPDRLRRAVGSAFHPLAMATTRERARRSLHSSGVGLPVLVGFFRGVSGISQSVQLASRALDHLKIEHRKIDIGDLQAPNRPDSFSSAAWLFHLNAPEHLLLLRSWGADQLKGPRYGYWAWELPKAPPSWRRTATIMAGVITPSQFTAKSLAGAGKISVSPYPLVAAEFETVPRHPPRRTGDIFRVVSLFDFKSSEARKNPLGAVRAFSDAFGADPTAKLTIKASNGDFAPDLRRRLKDMAGPNVEIVDARWERERVLAFIASADALISLHRSEGFGLTLAEAMMLGVPTVATAWSGNLEFMDETSSCLVPARVVRIKDAQGIYANQSWAEPDHQTAVNHLRRLRQDPIFANDLAARAKAAAMTRLSPEAWFDTLPPRLQAVFRPGGADQ